MMNSLGQGGRLRQSVAGDPVPPKSAPLPIVIEQRLRRGVPVRRKEIVMTFIEPDNPGGVPEITPPDPPGPDIDPGRQPEEMPQPDPGGGGEGDARPYA